MQRVRGFTLVEIAVVLVIVSLIAAVMFAGLRTATTSAKYRTTNQVLQNADAALVNFVTLAKRLPCPANGGLPPGDVNFGREMTPCTATTDQTNGVVPWVTLGLPQADVTDGFGNLITYRVSAGLVVADSMNFTACDSVGGSLTPAATPSTCACPDPLVGTTVPGQCTNYNSALGGKGIAVNGIAMSDPAANPPTGAAYVLISQGANQGPAFSPQGALSPGVGTIGSNEGPNAANVALQAAYFDVAIDGSDTPSHFDDILLHPSVSNVASRAGVSARTHLPAP